MEKDIFTSFDYGVERQYKNQPEVLLNISLSFHIISSSAQSIQTASSHSHYLPSLKPSFIQPSTCNSQLLAFSSRLLPSQILPLLFVILQTTSKFQKLTTKQCNAGQNCCYNNKAACYSQHSSTCQTAAFGSLVGQCPCDTETGAKDICAKPTCVSPLLGGYLFAHTNMNIERS